MARRFPFGDRNVQDDLRTTLMESHLLMQKTVLSAMVIFFKRGKAQGISFFIPHTSLQQSAKHTISMPKGSNAPQ